MTTHNDTASFEEAADASAPAPHDAPPAEPRAPHTFSELGLNPQILQVLDRLGFVIPTPIQHSAIPVVIKGEDIIGIAQTGTGKTLAFGLPILHRFVEAGNRSRGRSLVILPTRELALQVEETLQKVGAPFRLRTTVLIGGAPMRPQLSSLRLNPDIIVATPGRLIDHLQSRSVDLRTVDTLVLDEADRMLDMGFAPQIKQILREVPDERQTLLFSATMPDAIVDIAANYMHKPVRVEIARAGTAAEDVTQEMFIVPQEEKNNLLERLLVEYKGTILVFARTRSRARRVARHLKNAGHSAAEIHSDRTLEQRKAALAGFKSGQYRILVATDIAARGIDVTGIELVLNYDLPDVAEDYVHRIGRTGRAGRSGHAISFAAPDQGPDVRDIEKLLRVEVPTAPDSPLPRLASANPLPPQGQGRSRSGGRGRSGGGRPGGSRPSQGGMHSTPREGGYRDGGRPSGGSGSGGGPSRTGRTFSGRSGGR